MQYYFNEATLIQAIRKIYGYSQQEFCTFLGYSQATLSKIENGVSSPDMKFVIALSQKINIDLNMFKYGYVPKIPDYLFTNKRSRFLQHPYLKNGVFPSKTSYLLLESIKEKLGVDIYSKLKMPREYFVFLELKYSVQLFKDILLHVDVHQVIDVIKAVKAQSSPLLAEETFKTCLLDLHSIQLQNVVRIGDSYEIGLSYVDSLFNQNSELKEYFQHIIAFHLLNELNVNVTPVTQTKSKYDFVLRLNAS
jgi:transcriptional regulator with XRE-family HTH domain